MGALNNAAHHFERSVLVIAATPPMVVAGSNAADRFGGRPISVPDLDSCPWHWCVFVRRYKLNRIERALYSSIF